MLSSYQAGYYSGRFCTRVLKGYFVAKIIKKSFSKVGEIAKIAKIAKFHKPVSKFREIAKFHKIDSKSPVAVTENIFNCLEFLN